MQKVRARASARSTPSIAEATPSVAPATRAIARRKPYGKIESRGIGAAFPRVARTRGIGTFRFLPPIPFASVRFRSTSVPLAFPTYVARLEQYFVSSGFAFVHADSTTDICAVEAVPVEQRTPRR